jgi:hypothetical protein
VSRDRGAVESDSTTGPRAMSFRGRNNFAAILFSQANNFASAAGPAPFKTPQHVSP